jgi:hypothetical protein
MKEEYYGVKRPIDMALRIWQQNAIPDFSVLIEKSVGASLRGRPISKTWGGHGVPPLQQIKTPAFRTTEVTNNSQPFILSLHVPNLALITYRLSRL